MLNKKITLGFVSSNGYMNHYSVLFASILRTQDLKNTDLKICIVHTPEEREDVERFKKSWSDPHISFDTYEYVGEVDSRYGVACEKLRLCQYFPNEEYIIYMDGDMIFNNQKDTLSNLTKMAEGMMKDHVAVGICPNFTSFVKEEVRPGEFVYLNAGLMIFNTKQYLKEFSKIKDSYNITELSKKFKYPEQSQFINDVLGNKISIYLIPYAYNYGVWTHYDKNIEENVKNFHNVFKHVLPNITQQYMFDMYHPVASTPHMEARVLHWAGSRCKPWEAGKIKDTMCEFLGDYELNLQALLSFEVEGFSRVFE